MPKQLGQANSVTTAAEIYAPAAGMAARNLRMHVVETNGADAVFTLFHDTDGAVMTDVTTIYEGSVLANRTEVIKLTHIEVSNSSHGIGVQASTANVTFTLYGDEFVA